MKTTQDVGVYPLEQLQPRLAAPHAPGKEDNWNAHVFLMKVENALRKKLVKGCLAIANQFKYIFVCWHPQSPSYYIYPRKMKIFHAKISLTMSSMASIVTVSNRNSLGVIKKKMEKPMLICTFIGMFKNTEEETE